MKWFKGRLVKLYEKFRMILLANLKLDGYFIVMCDKSRENVFLTISAKEEGGGLRPMAKLLSEKECIKYGKTLDEEESLKLTELFFKLNEKDTRKKISEFDEAHIIDGMDAIFFEYENEEGKEV